MAHLPLTPKYDLYRKSIGILIGLYYNTHTLICNNNKKLCVKITAQFFRIPSGFYPYNF